ncbi:MAG: rhamnogalacturonan lyase [Clostridia bacterium]|nr:rhamnogalacturonan lyase [Clostridia bacterium]
MKKTAAALLSFILVLGTFSTAFMAEPPEEIAASAFFGWNFTTQSYIADAKAVSWNDYRGAFITFPLPEGFSVGDDEAVYARFYDNEMTFDNGRKNTQAPIVSLRLTNPSPLENLTHAKAISLRDGAESAAVFDTLNADGTNPFDVTDYIKNGGGYVTFYLTCRSEDNAFQTEGIVKFNAPHLTLTCVPLTLKPQEEINRSLVAVGVDGGVFLSWRANESDGEYTIFRDGEKIAATNRTNYTDPYGSAESVYTVEGFDTTVWQDKYLEIKLDVPEPDSVTGATYSPNDASVGDLDGDGEYEIVLKWDPSDSKDSASNGRTGKVFIDAYKLDGTKMWRIDMGRNVRAGAHDTQFLVYDFDQDGCAEIAMRTADGTTDSAGNVIGDASAVWTDNDLGKNLEGPLFVSIFSGRSGKVLATVNYDPQSDEPSTRIFGDNFGNRSERYLACVAYLDGERPSMVFVRGYYSGRSNYGPGRTVVAAYDFENGALTKRWRFDTMDEGNEQYIGQGNHNISVADADSDGCDEIFLGSLTLDNDGSVLWCSFLGHGDAQHLGDFDPTREGLEYFTVHESETSGQKYGFTIHDAATGEVLISRSGGQDTGRGVIANIGNFGGSFVAWASSGAGYVNSLNENLALTFSPKNFRIYWDGDLYDELLDGTNIYKVMPDGAASTIFNAYDEGCAANNSTKSTPCLSADILGDWREEVIWRTQDNSALRIYTTTIPTEHTLSPLMTDHVYRMGVAWQNVGYNQPPHLGYYVTEELPTQLEASDFYGWNFTTQSFIDEAKAVSWGDWRGAFITFEIPEDFFVAESEVVSAVFSDSAMTFDNGRQWGQAPIVTLFALSPNSLSEMDNAAAAALRNSGRNAATLDTLNATATDSFDVTEYLTNNEQYITFYLSSRSEDNAFESEGIVKFNAPRLTLTKSSAAPCVSVTASLSGSLSQNTFAYTVSIQNTAFEKTRLSIIEALYSDNTLVGITRRAVGVQSRSNISKTYAAQLPNGASARVFMWSGAMAPLCETLYSN